MDRGWDRHSPIRYMTHSKHEWSSNWAFNWRHDSMYYLLNCYSISDVDKEANHAE